MEGISMSLNHGKLAIILTIAFFQLVGCSRFGSLDSGSVSSVTVPKGFSRHDDFFAPPNTSQRAAALSNLSSAIPSTRYSLYWPNGTVPIKFADNISQTQRQIIWSATQDWERNGGMRFVAHTNQEVYALITNKGPGSGCNATLGYFRNEQMPFLNLEDACWSKPIAMHELGHVIGLVHEHQRPDRDDYIDITTTAPWVTAKVESAVVTPYDPTSAMHYCFSSLNYFNLKNVKFDDAVDLGSICRNDNDYKLSYWDREATKILYSKATNTAYTRAPVPPKKPTAQQLESIRRAYLDGFGREPNAAEYADWSAQFMNSGANYDSIIGAIRWSYSVDGNLTRATVRSAYLTGFGREPSEAEYGDWGYRLQNKISIYSDIIGAIRWSYSVDANQTRGAVRSAYLTGFGREPSEAEYGDWGYRLRSGIALYSDIIGAIRWSLGVNKGDERYAIRMAYLNGFGREPNESEYNYWGGRIRSGDTLYADILAVIRSHLRQQ
jgi:Astacin (Peptidase family M12A)